jgi:hypothetical protein
MPYPLGMDVTYTDQYAINRRREARHQLDTLARKAVVVAEPRPWDLPGRYEPSRRTAADFRRAADEALAAGRKGRAAAYRAHATRIDAAAADTGDAGWSAAAIDALAAIREAGY